MAGQTEVDRSLQSLANYKWQKNVGNFLAVLFNISCTTPDTGVCLHFMTATRVTKEEDQRGKDCLSKVRGSVSYCESHTPTKIKNTYTEPSLVLYMSPYFSCNLSDSTA